MSDNFNRKFHTIISLGRGFGRTEAMIKGAENVKGCIIVAANRSHAEHIKKRTTAKVITLEDLEKTTGLHVPIIADHYTLQVLWEERERQFKNTISKLRREFLKEQQNDREV